MPSESDLRNLLHGPDPEGRAAIDVDAVLTRARRRRRPKVVAAQALGSVALVGVLGTAIVVSLPRPAEQATMTAQDAPAGAGESATQPFADQDALTAMSAVCGEPVAFPPASPDLVLEISMETIFEPESRIPVTVTLRNTGAEIIRGSTGAAPLMTFARDGIVLWHSFAAPDGGVRAIDLDPGESVTYETYFDRTVCGSEDDLVVDDPANPLPAAGPGQYEVFATLTLSGDDGTSAVASGPPMSLEIAG